MSMKGLAITAGIGAAMGAVAILMMPKNNPTRQLADKAADKMENAVTQMESKLSSKLDNM